MKVDDPKSKNWMILIKVDGRATVRIGPVFNIWLKISTEFRPVILSKNSSKTIIWYLQKLVSAELLIFDIFEWPLKTYKGPYELAFRHF